MKVTLDLSAEERLGAERDLQAAARQERDAVRSVQVIGGLVAGAAGLILLVAVGLVLLWLDDRWALTSTERTVARILFVLAALALLLAAALAAAAAWPLRRRPLDELRVAVREPRDDADRQRGRRLAYAATEAAQRDRLQRGASLRWSLGLFVAGLAFLAAQGAVFAFAAGGDPKPSGPKPPKEDPVAKLARTHAPQFALHRKEHFGPMDPQRYLATARLRWRRPGPDPTVRRGARVESAIGAACTQRCAAFGPYRPDQLTRPFRSGAHRPLQLVRGEGFYIDASDLMHTGELVTAPQVPVFYEGNETQITYWAFFAFTQPFGVKRSPAGREGDWEAMTLRFGAKKQPTELLLDRPGASRSVAWDSLEHAGTTHPVIYVTARSHELATKASRGQRSTKVCAGTGKRRRCVRRVRGDRLLWQPWTTELMRKLSEQPWYGFGGAWGETGKNSRSTGELGPSSFRPAP